MIKYQVMRVTGEGEQQNVEVTVPTKVEMEGTKAIVQWMKAHVYDPCDIRLAENSKRIMDAMGFVQQVPEPYRPYVSLVVKNVIDMIYGRLTPQQTVPIPAEVVEKDKLETEREKAKLELEGVQLEPRAHAAPRRA